MTAVQEYSSAKAQTAWGAMIKRLVCRYLEHRNKRRALAELKSIDSRTLKDMAIDRSEVASIVYSDPRERRRSYAENKIMAPYEGHRWCDATERELTGHITSSCTQPRDER
jgi:uncharacterized protein YjiS (DUF1127 family)